MNDIIKIGYSFIIKDDGIKCFSDYINIIEQIFACLRIPINHFYISYIKDKKAISRSFNYTDTNIKKYLHLTYKDITGILVTNNDTKIHFPTNFNVCIDFNNIRIDNSNLEITITYKTNIGIKGEHLPILKSIIEIIASYGQIVRGFGIVMENDKIPEVFLKGILSESLSIYEESTAYSIAVNKGIKSNKLPDIFLINILPAALFPDKLLDEVISIVGKDHLLRYNDEYILIDLPVTLKDYLNKKDINNVKEKLSNLLLEHGLLNFIKKPE